MKKAVKILAIVLVCLAALADNDSFSDDSLAYQEVLAENDVYTEVKGYDGAIHGFIEENNPEYEDLHIKVSKSPEQEQMAREAEAYIGAWLDERFAR